MFAQKKARVDRNIALTPGVRNAELLDNLQVNLTPGSMTTAAASAAGARSPPELPEGSDGKNCQRKENQDDGHQIQCFHSKPNILPN
jgi:hypothetical protein